MQQGSGGAGAGTSGSEISRGVGLPRYRSAPANWLEALLEPENNVVSNHPSPILHSSNKPPTHPQSQGLPIPTTTSGLFESGGNSGISNFVRQNSSPAEYFSSFDLPSNYGYVSSPLDVSQSAKRSREGELDISPAKLSSQLKGEPGQLRSAGRSLDTEMEKLMEDLVPCKVRAKRGCATHPRSIAERVRRTRISDRIRKLQELVPNMDKQTNTADMLEEAVEYVKFLQKQIQELREHQKKCTCSMKE